MLFLQALLLLGAPAALAETITKTATSIRTDFCRTILTPTNNGPVPTNTRKTTVTWPFPDHSTSTSTSTKTITPEVCTQTETSFSTKRYYTTATQKVDTVSTTTTVYTVSVITKTNTETGKLPLARCTERALDMGGCLHGPLRQEIGFVLAGSQRP